MEANGFASRYCFKYSSPLYIPFSSFFVFSCHSFLYRFPFFSYTQCTKHILDIEKNLSSPFFVPFLVPFDFMYCYIAIYATLIPLLKLWINHSTTFVIIFLFNFCDFRFSQLSFFYVSLCVCMLCTVLGKMLSSMKIRKTGSDLFESLVLMNNFWDFYVELLLDSRFS